MPASSARLDHSTSRMQPLLPIFLLLLSSRQVFSVGRNITCRRTESANSSLLFDCSRRKINSYGFLEGNRFKAATDLILSNNNISDFPVARIANHLPHLRRLRLDGNSVSAPTATDTSWPSLRHLDLSGNRLSEVQNRHFVFGRHLVSLNLSSNRVRSVAPNAWLNVNRLEFLDLSNNGIVFVSEDWFWGLWRLQELKLAGNAIFHLFQRTFTHLRTLKRLDLSANKLRIVDQKAFAEQSELEEMRMDNNHLDAFPKDALRHFKRVKVADFSANRFYRLDAGAVSDFNVSELILERQRRLVSVSPGAFRRLAITHRLRLSKSPELRYVAPDAFHNCPSLTRLEIARNALVAVPVEALWRNLVSLVSLDISGNPLRCQCSLVDALRAIRSPRRLLKAANTTCSHTGQRFLVLDPNATCDSAPIAIGTFREEMGLPEGHSLTFQCRSYPSTNVSVEWRLPRAADRDEAIRKRLVVASDGDLDIKDALPSHSGSYACLATAPDGAQSDPVTVDVTVRPLKAHLLLLERRATSLVVTWRRESSARRSMSSMDGILRDNLLVIYRASTATHFRHLMVQAYMKSATLSDLAPNTPYLVCLAISSPMDVHRLHCLHTSTTEERGRGHGHTSDWFQNGTFVVVIVATLGVSLGLLVACLIYCNLQKDAKVMGRHPHDSTVSLAALESGASTPMAFENRAIMEDVDGEAEAEFGSHLSLREMAALACRQPFVVPERPVESTSRPEERQETQESGGETRKGEEGSGEGGATSADVHEEQECRGERFCVT